MHDNHNNDYNARANDMNRISAANTDFMDDEPEGDESTDLSEDTGPPFSEGFDSINDDEAVYQDDLNYANDAVDSFSDEATDDPTEELRVPPEEFKEEMDKLALDDREDDNEDLRETLEDRDEADDSPASSS